MNAEAHMRSSGGSAQSAGEGEKVLARIREALTATGHRAEDGRHGFGGTRAADARSVLPVVGRGFEEDAALFLQNALDLKADFRLLKDAGEAPAVLAGMRAAEHWQSAASHHGPLTDAVCSSLGLPVLFSDAPFDKHELAQCDVGITECDALVAQTGTVVVTSRSAGGRALSVLPPHHVVLARRDQLVPGLPDAFDILKQKYGASYPSMISLITGPSRTSDIERILVLGAHGPKKLTILCW